MKKYAVLCLIAFQVTLGPAAQDLQLAHTIPAHGEAVETLSFSPTQKP